MAFNDLPARFASYGAQSTKDIVIVVKIAGIKDVFSSAPVFTRVHYGDPIVYGTPGIVYGGLRPFVNADGSTFRSYLSLDKSSVSINQKIEPEQGRSSVSQLTLAFIDKDQFMTGLITPGVLIPEPLGAVIKVYVGYQEISYPEDFLQIYRGRISAVDSNAGLVTIQCSDPNVVRRQNIAYMPTTTLAADMTNSQTSVTVVSATDFPVPIVGPNGLKDGAVRYMMLIDNEWIDYTGATITPSGSNSLISPVIRNVHPPGDVITQPTGAVTHNGTSQPASVAPAVQLGLENGYTPPAGFSTFTGGNPALVTSGNPIDLALKIMLSGWNGPYSTGNTIQNFVDTRDPVLGMQSNAILLPGTTNAVLDLGLSAGDYVTITGDANAGNNGTFIVAVSGFANANGGVNNVVYLNQTSGSPAVFTLSYNSAGTFSIRSQYDTLPKALGLKLFGDEVDVARFQLYRQQFINTDQLRFGLKASISGKTFIDTELMLAVSAYSLTRNGRLSMGITLPPIADTRLSILDQTNVLNPDRIKPIRALNNRKFFNEVDWNYDPDVNGTFRKTTRTIDTTSLNLVGMVYSLPISSKGTRADLNAFRISSRTSLFLQRYKRGAIQIPIQTNYGAGVGIEAGDVVVVNDNGQLQIPDLTKGIRNIGSGIFEVIDRTIDFKSGMVSLGLLSGLNFTLADRFATWAPSSFVRAGSTTTALNLIDSTAPNGSYGGIFGSQEGKKWAQYVGLNIKVHNLAFTQVGHTTIQSITNVNTLNVSPALSFTPVAGVHVIDLDDYPTSTDPSQQALAKLIHIFWDHTAPVTGSISTTQFSVSAGDATFFKIGNPILIHKANWSVYYDPQSLGIPQRVNVTGVSGTTITIDTTLPFTPDTTYNVDILPFADGGSPYEWV